MRLFGDAPRIDDAMRRVERALLTDLNHLPVLLVYGEHDPTRKEGFQARWERIFPQARSVVIAGAGHFPHEDAPDEVAAAVRDWLRSIERHE